MIAVVVLAAHLHDNTAGIVLLDKVAEHTDGTVHKALVDPGLQQATTVLPRAEDVCRPLGRDVLPKNIEGTRAKQKRPVKLGILTEADTGNFAGKQ
ncbi:hypothetical protein [Streptomyces sp. NPDC056683]|uniref:hypothetical protein n=1 Tax=Streptomyces sp. NPDC056683 TaxID=3345910 RepID=UPI0036CD5407